MVKIALSFCALLFALPVCGPCQTQDQTQGLVDVVRVALGCGPSDTQFEVKTEKQHPAAHLEAGKAMVYFIEDDNKFSSYPRPTTRVGIDGAWVGATHGNSYFYVPVGPGEHNLCVRWQKKVLLGLGIQTATAHFIAEAGKKYYFMTQNCSECSPAANIQFGPFNSDEAQLLINNFSYSTFHPKK